MIGQDVREEALEVAGVRVRLQRAGTGRPLLYLHGAFEVGGWLEASSRLAESLDVIAPDHLGFGGSERPPWLDTVEDLAYHTVDLLDALRVERAHLVGVDLGGWLAAELALRFPHRVDRLVLIGPAGLKIDEAPPTHFFGIAPERWAELVYADPAGRPAVTDLPLADQVRNQNTTARLMWNPSSNPKLRLRLPRIAAPTLVLMGEHDRLVPRRHGEVYAGEVRDGRLEVIPGAGHLAHVERPEAAAGRIAAFLDASPSPSEGEGRGGGA
jgi:pimeloyl-ACP methyl ester carboxylesterase